MPQFLDLLVANDPLRSRSEPFTEATGMLLEPSEIRSMREQIEVRVTLVGCGWDLRSAREQQEDGCPSLVGLTLSSGATVWAFHDLDDVLRAIAYLRANPESLVVQVGDVPSAPRAAA